ncbi:nucleotide exchange factor GrpE [Marinagarivorans algicola]|uniref:nucleotide exchange factor GrpE n=1 Tax=Marinagarivorans algicola TaxID=1513270 RepID=UPI000B317A4E|nr:nucleotide exchange factor GrpE [Marinagarivorans algicola]
MSKDPSNVEDLQAEGAIDEQLQDDQVELSSEAEEIVEQDEVALLHAEIAALKEQAANANEQALRAAAEAQNARRRAEQDVEKAHKFALEKFVNDMLPVVDNLERSIEAAKGEQTQGEQSHIETLIEGVDLTLKSLVDALKRHNVEAVNPAGEPFDPQFHQAMSMVPDPNVEPNTVINVFQNGYTLNGRLVRPAMVVVSKAP